MTLIDPKWPELARYVVELEQQGEAELALATIEVLKRNVGDAIAAKLLREARGDLPS